VTAQDQTWKARHDTSAPPFLRHNRRGRARGGGVCGGGADAKTDEELWNAKVQDYYHACYVSLDPLIADVKVMVGVSGG
jgi:hypothetical protein